MSARIPDDRYVATVGVRVGYVDTDRAQVVHHSTYLRYLEMARVEYLRSRQYDYRSLEYDQGMSLAVVEANVRYRAGARFDDELVLKTWIGLVNRAKLRFDSVILRGDEVMTTAEITCCCVKLSAGRIASIPPELIAMGR
ncbi:MAG: thioesterase family protein [Polyangiales bacterium]